MNNRLKALLLTDWYSMKLMYISTFIMILACSGTALASAMDTGKAVLNPACMMGLYGILLNASAFGYDKLNNVGTARRAMPYTDRELVLFRYLPIYAAALFYVIVTVLVLVIGGAAHGFAEGFGKQLMFSIATGLDVMLILPMLFYPFIFRYGYAKVQNVYGVISALLALAGFSAFMYLTVGSSDDSISTAFTVPYWVSFANILLICAFSAISLKVSVRHIGEAE